MHEPKLPIYISRHQFDLDAQIVAFKLVKNTHERIGYMMLFDEAFEYTCDAFVKLFAKTDNRPIFDGPAGRVSYWSETAYHLLIDRYRRQEKTIPIDTAALVPAKTSIGDVDWKCIYQHAQFDAPELIVCNMVEMSDYVWPTHKEIAKELLKAGLPATLYLARRASDGAKAKIANAMRRHCGGGNTKWPRLE